MTHPSEDPPAATLAREQEALVRALVAGAPTPPGFDTAALADTADALLHKRAAEVVHRFPRLAYACGPDFTSRYLAWARTRPKTTTAADAAAFAAATGLPAPHRKPLHRRLFRR